MVAKQDLLQALKDIQKEPYTLTAICTSVRGRLNKLPRYQRNISQELDDMLLRLFQKWPKHSRNPRYPVPSVTPGLTASEQFNVIAVCRDSFWEGEYGGAEKRASGILYCSIGERFK